jgi:hypothetical protein
VKCGEQIALQFKKEVKVNLEKLRRDKTPLKFTLQKHGRDIEHVDQWGLSRTVMDFPFL